MIFYEYHKQETINSINYLFNHIDESIPNLGKPEKDVSKFDLECLLRTFPDPEILSNVNNVNNMFYAIYICHRNLVGHKDAFDLICHLNNFYGNIFDEITLKKIAIKGSKPIRTFVPTTLWYNILNLDEQKADKYGWLKMKHAKETAKENKDVSAKRDRIIAELYFEDKSRSLRTISNMVKEQLPEAKCGYTTVRNAIIRLKLQEAKSIDEVDFVNNLTHSSYSITVQKFTRNNIQQIHRNNDTIDTELYIDNYIMNRYIDNDNSYQYIKIQKNMLSKIIYKNIINNIKDNNILYHKYIDTIFTRYQYCNHHYVSHNYVSSKKVSRKNIDTKNIDTIYNDTNTIESIYVLDTSYVEYYGYREPIDYNIINKKVIKDILNDILKTLNMIQSSFVIQNIIKKIYKQNIINTLKEYIQDTHNTHTLNMRIIASENKSLRTSIKNIRDKRTTLSKGKILTNNIAYQSTSLYKADTNKLILCFMVQPFNNNQLLRLSRIHALSPMIHFQCQTKPLGCIKQLTKPG